MDAEAQESAGKPRVCVHPGSVFKHIVKKPRKCFPGVQSLKINGKMLRGQRTVAWRTRVLIGGRRTPSTVPSDEPQNPDGAQGPGPSTLSPGGRSPQQTPRRGEAGLLSVEPLE